MTNKAPTRQLTIILGGLCSVTTVKDKCSEKELKVAINKINKLINKLKVVR